MEKKKKLESMNNCMRKHCKGRGHESKWTSQELDMAFHSVSD